MLDLSTATETRLAAPYTGAFQLMRWQLPDAIIRQCNGPDTTIDGEFFPSIGFSRNYTASSTNAFFHEVNIELVNTDQSAFALVMNRRINGTYIEIWEYDSGYSAPIIEFSGWVKHGFSAGRTAMQLTASRFYHMNGRYPRIRFDPAQGAVKSIAQPGRKVTIAGETVVFRVQR